MLKKLLFILCFLLSFSLCFSEKYFQISETELNQIQAETLKMTNSVETLTESVKKLEYQKNQYLTLSNELKKENQQLQQKVKNYRYITIGISAGLIVGGVIAYKAK